MKIKCDKDNFFKIYNEMQGVALKGSRIRRGKKVRIHFYTFYVKILFLISVFIILFRLIFRVYNLFIKILITQIVPIFGTIAIFMLFIYSIGYSLAKKRLGGEVELKTDGVEDREKDGLIFFAPWSLIDFAYLGKYGIYFFVRKRLVIFGHNSQQKEIRKYLEENKIDVLVYNVDN